jgi:hypothetical protein
MSDFFPLFLNVALPLFAGLVFFAMALYVKHIGPLRMLIAGELTYQGAFWGFLFLGIYLASRPIQILFPHPWPLIINNIREFGLIGIFGPAVFLAMMSLVFGHDNIPRGVVRCVMGAGLVLAVVFVVTNIFAIGGSEVIFKVGAWEAHDGVWFRNPEARRGLMRVLFVVRVLDPILLLFVSGTVVLWRAASYPPEKKVLYDNMPRKLLILGLACYAFSLSMFAVGLVFLVAHIANQWWIYYAGSLTSGVLETVSLSLPMKRHVSVSEHL